MRIISPRGKEIASLDEWRKLHSDIHWKEGRSAHSIADFILNCDGVAHLESRLSELLQGQVSIDLIIPEKGIRFDRYRGKTRTHDLAIQGCVDADKALFVGLEAKVDEDFGRTIQDQIDVAGKELARNSRSRAIDRIDALPARFSPPLTLSEMLDIRYQLVHGTAGTVSARQANGEPYNLYIFYVLVFKTCLYDEQAGEQNFCDYLRFINRVGAADLEHPGIEAHAITMDDRPLICIYEYVELPA